ncbi:MAG: TIGR03016 family PEP-CTERM system-associated outer membrane protein [Pseudomonadota bacterium]
MQGGTDTGAQLARRGYGWRNFPLVLAVVVSGQTATAGEWRVNTYLDFAEVYTDNVSLAPAGEEQDEFVTQISPGIGVSGQSGRAKLNLNYRLQNLIYGHDLARSNSNHQLLANGNLELIKNWFFVDAKSSISQQIVDADASVPLDNFNIGNRADVITYGVSPYLKLRFGSYAAGEMRYGIDRVENQSTALSDTEITQYSARLGSGPNFNRLNWGMNFRHEEMSREFGPDSLRENASAVVRYRFHQTFNALARGGYENNDVVTTRSIKNGSYWSVGGEWLPSRYATLSATAGENNWDADVYLQPTARTQLHVGYQDLEVGLNPGGVWTADFSHHTRRSTWRLSYVEESTSTQILQLADRQFFLVVDSNGNLLIDPRTGFPVVIVNNIFALTDEEFIRQRFQGSVTWKSGKSDFVLGAYNEQREFEISNNSEDVLGANASWIWRLKPRTQSILGGGWQHRNPAGTNEADELWYASLGFNRSISQDVNSSLEFRHTERASVRAGEDYDENRLTLQLSMRF